MKIGIASPVATEDVLQHLDGNIGLLPQGCRGAPLIGTLISVLIERGHEVSVYTLDVTSPSLRQTMVATGRSFKLYIVPYRPHSIRFNGKRPGRIMDFYKDEIDALQKAIKIDKPDVVHAHWSYEFALAAIVSGIPYVITCHDSPLRVLQFIPNLYRLGRYFMAKHVFKKGKNFTAVSEYLKNEVQPYIRFSVKVIPNPVPLELFKKIFLGRINRFDSNRPKIGMVLNNWQRRKNPESALKAFAILKRQISGATLHLFGNDFGVGEKCQIWAEKHDISNGMVFHGFMPHDKFLKKLEDIDLLIHPSLEEACSMSVIEAMALGMPVIGGSKSGGIPWILDYGKAGILTNVQSNRLVYQALIEVIKDKALYEKLSQSAQERAIKIFSPTAVVAAYEKMYAMAIADDIRTI